MQKAKSTATQKQRLFWQQIIISKWSGGISQVQLTGVNMHVIHYVLVSYIELNEKAF